MKRLGLGLGLLLVLVVAAYAQLTFFMIDNFEDGAVTKWYMFDNIKPVVVENPAKADNDSVGDACGEKSLNISGHADNWYVGGMGTILDLDGSAYTRFNVDVFGSKKKGKIKIELFERKSAAGTDEAKWIAEIPVLGDGFTRYSIPLSSFSTDDDKKIVFHPKNGGKISKMQLIYIAASEKADIDLTVDNLIFTF